MIRRPRRPAAGGKTKAGGGPDWAALERVLGVRFKDRALLRQALVHRSILNEQRAQNPPQAADDPGGEPLESYERLEYLGDAFLGWVVAHELFVRWPAFSEGELTRARASLVQGRTLAGIARGIGLGAYLRLGQGEGSTGGRERTSNLAAVFEAVVGAVLMDRGEKAARALVMRHLGAPMDAIAPSGVPRDAKSAFQELTQRLGLPLPAYELLTADGPPHARRFTVRVLVDGVPRGEGTGARKADAEQAAAAIALDSLTP